MEKEKGEATAKQAEGCEFALQSLFDAFQPATTATACCTPTRHVRRYSGETGGDR